MFRRLVLLGLLIGLPHQGFGQTHSGPADSDVLYDLSLKDLLAVRLVTAASGFEQLQEEVPAAVTTIMAEEWQATGARTLFEAVNRVVGVHISKTQTGVANNKPVIRGTSGTFGQQILVLMDGVPFRRIRDGGTFQGQRVPLTGIKRIEIIRSPGSVIYGADAVGGIINMVTYAPGEAPSMIAARYGEFATRDFALVHSQRLGEHALQWAAETQASNDDPDRRIDADLQTSLDRLFGTQASRAPGRFAENYEIYNVRGQWQYRWLSANANVWKNAGSGVGAGIAQALDPDGIARQRAETYSLAADLSTWVAGDMTLSASWRREFSDVTVALFPAGARLPVGTDGNLFSGPRLVTFTEGVRGTPGGESRAASLQLEHVYSPAKNHLVRWAIGAEHAEIHATETKNFGAGVLQPDITSVGAGMTDVTNTPYIYLPDKSRTLSFVSLLDQWRLSDRWSGTFGVRVDEYSDFGSAINPRLGMVWHAADMLTLKLFSGTAFRAPSFVDLYAQNNPSATGNPNLEPEKNRTSDLGMGASLLPSEDLQLDLNFFRYKTENIIRFEPVGPVQVANNGGVQEGQGVEMQVNWRATEGFTLTGNYHYLDSRTNRGTDISAVPQQMANLGLFYRPESWHWYLGAKWVSDRERAATDTRPDIADYWLIDTHWEIRMQNWHFNISGKNLLGRDAREPSNPSIPGDFPLQGSQWSLGIGYTFATQ